MKVKKPRRFRVFGQVLLEYRYDELWYSYFKVCTIRSGFSCLSSVIVENAIMILALLGIEQINTIDSTHTEAYQRNILTKLLEWMGKPAEVGNNGEKFAKHIGAYRAQAEFSVHGFWEKC